MSIYSTPLHVGYFLALVMCCLFVYRGYREERLSDKLLGFVMLLLALQMQDYTFGFSGINFLWEEMNGFPRGVSLLFGPAIYFYLRAQINRRFHLKKKHLLHLLPWLFFFLIHLFFFLQGKYTVQWWQASEANKYLGYLNYLANWMSYGYYFYQSITLYHHYRDWAGEQFSDQDIISFRWFRNFIYLMLGGVLFMQIMFVLDWIFEWDFSEDWWWNLGLVVITFYVGIQGYAQAQPANINFSKVDPVKEKLHPTMQSSGVDWREKIETLMQSQKPYLNPNLNLRELSILLNTNSTTLSGVINQCFGKNFNDFINGYRVQEFEERINRQENLNFTILAIGLDCGFNSKATFNRAVRKISGKSPNELRLKSKEG